MTLEEITEALTFDTRPLGPDGCSNVDRIAYVAEVFQLDDIDLTLDYDFTQVIHEKDPVPVLAAKHLALLKIDYLNRLYEHFYLTDEDYAAEVPALILAVQRINWHLHHLERGLPTPPYPAFH